MNIAKLHSLDSSYLDTDALSIIFRFDERRKCLNTVFRYIYNQMHHGKRILMVVKSEDELEYLNYFLSRYKLQHLSLILNQESDFVSWYAVQKIKNVERKYGVQGDEHAMQTVEKLRAEYERMYKRYHEGQLGKLSLFDAWRMVENAQVSPMRLELYKLIAPEKYKEKKLMVQKAFGMFKSAFRYDDKMQIFNAGVFDEYTIESLLVVLKHLKEKAELLVADFYKKEDKIYSELEQKFNSEIRAVKKLVSQYSELESMDASSTIEAKKRYLIGKILGLVDMGSEKQLIETEALRHAVQQWENAERARLNVHFNKLLSRLNAFNSQYELEGLFSKTDALIDEIRNADILEVGAKYYCNDLYNYKTKLLEEEKRLAKAIYFLENEPEQVEWCVFYDKLMAEDKLIIDKLKDVDYDWVACFELTYVKSFLNYQLTHLDSLQAKHEPLVEALKAFDEQDPVHIEAQYEYDMEDEGLSEFIEQSKQGQLWKVFARDHGAELFSLYPLIVVKQDFYVEHGNRLESYADCLLYLNTEAINVSTGDDKQRVMAFNTEQYDLDISAFKSLEDLQIIDLPGVEFNINRSAHFLKGTELSSMSLYLAEAIKYFNPSYRIYQLRDCAIVSLLSRENNARVFFKFESDGVKEIFNQDEDQNLIPAVLNENIQSTFILVEDMMINPNDFSELLQQKWLLEKMRIAGLNVLSLDNFKLLSRSGDEVQSIVDKIRSRSKKLSLLESDA